MLSPHHFMSHQQWVSNKPTNKKKKAEVKNAIWRKTNNNWRITPAQSHKLWEPTSNCQVFVTLKGHKSNRSSLPLLGSLGDPLSWAGICIFIPVLARVSESSATRARVGCTLTGYFVTKWNLDCKAFPAKQQRQGGLPWCVSAFRVRCSELQVGLKLVRVTAPQHRWKLSSLIHWQLSL